MRHARFTRSLLTAIALLLLSPAMAFAQKDTGTIIGTVNDEHGTPLAGAKITLVAENAKAAKSQTMDASTDGTGEFRFESVKPGRYTIRIDAKGLISKTETINVKPAHKTNVNVHLKLPTEPKPKSDNNNND
ncbi:MAG: carboxypeptidase-like regulatory domain-containing protein, partial [Candidatus Acidiferrales bacterium]